MQTSADLLLDTSAAVALFQQDHVFHAAVLRRADGLVLGLSGHAAAETLSVLTRLKPPRRVPGSIALEFIEREFPRSVGLRMTMSAALRQCVDAGVVGGAVYDGLVGIAAREAGVVLVSADQRASGTYSALGVPFELVCA